MKLSKPQNYNNVSSYITKTIEKIPVFNRNYILLTDKDKVKFYKMVETIIRASLEYKEYIAYLKEVIDMTQCSYFTKISSKDSKKKVSIEIHHEPFTLYDLCEIVCNKMYLTGKQINPLIVADEVMGLHYRNRVGLIPLSVTVHELVHSGNLFIPLQNVYGNFISFVEEYHDDMDSEMHSLLKKKIELSKEVVDVTILEKKYTYLTVDGFTLPQIIQ